MRAYDKTYLEKARTTLACMLDFAVYSLHFKLSSFYELFLLSDAAKRFESGDAQLLAGKSGIELAYAVADFEDKTEKVVASKYSMERSAEYWTGWALAYFQWETAMTFADINRLVPIDDICALYAPYHEMDIRQFVDKMKQLCRDAQPETNLKRLRISAGLSQKELAELCRIPLRQIQHYEQRQKNINKAQAEYIFALSKALSCNPESLMEKIADTGDSTD